MQKVHNRKPRPAWLTLLPAAVSVVLVGAVLFAASTAWITVNRKVKSQGLQMTAQTSGNLVIANSTSIIKKANILSNGSPFAVTFSSNAQTYLPATHLASVAVSATKGQSPTKNTYLQYVTSGKNVNVTTGQAKDGKTLTYATVPVTTTSMYYVDYKVYIASAGTTLTDQTLKVSITATDATSLADTDKALSVDFYVRNTMVSGSYYYRGTLNLAGYDRAKADAYNYSVKELTLYDDVDVPLNTQGYIYVIMRVYYDGALKKKSDTTFINSASLTTHKMGITVNFTTETKS